MAKKVLMLAGDFTEDYETMGQFLICFVGCIQLFFKGAVTLHKNLLFA